MTGDEWIDILDQLTAIGKAVDDELDVIDIHSALDDAIELVEAQAGQVLLFEYMKGRS